MPIHNPPPSRYYRANCKFCYGHYPQWPILWRKFQSNMKRILSTQYSETAFNVASLVLRLTFGLGLCINHGFDKLIHFSKLEYTFPDPFHIGHRWTLVCSIFAEVFCSLLLTLGLFTRIAALVLVINMAVATFLVHKGASLAILELPQLYLTGFFAILMVGPGRVSVDGMMGK